MKTAIRGIVFLLFFLLAGAGCSQESSEKSAPAANQQAQAQPSQPAQAGTPAETEAQPSPSQAPQKRPTGAEAQAAPQKAGPAPAAAPEPAVPTPEVAKAESPRQPQPETSKPAGPEKLAVADARQASAKDVMILKGAPMGGVRFEHKLHTERVGNKCETCHHPSQPEKPAMVPQQACSNCHTKVATPPMRTKYQGAFHNPLAQAGTCIDCHKTENAKRKNAPVKCLDCHKKENS